MECQDCGWLGDDSELMALTDELGDLDFSHCPDCFSQSLFDYDEDE